MFEQGELPKGVVGGTLLALRVEPPGVDKPIELYAQVLNGTSLRPLAQCGREHTLASRRHHDEEPRMFAKPVPHLRIIDKAGQRAGSPGGYMIHLYRRARGRGLHFSVYCQQGDWIKARPWVCKTLMDTRVHYPHWPTPAKNRKIKLQRGVGVSIGPGVEKAQLKIVQGCFKRVAKHLARFHGPPIDSGKEPYVVFVNLSRDDHAAVTGEQAKFDIFGGPVSRRTLTTPIGPPGSVTRGNLVDDAVGQYLGDLYGVNHPEWLYMGEAYLARMAAETGKSLPFVTTRFTAGIGHLDGAFADLCAKRKIRKDRFAYHSAGYVALLRHGPSIYKKAYKAFLTELRQTCNAPAATAKHLLVLDQAKMLADVQAMVRKLRGAKRKKR